MDIVLVEGTPTEMRPENVAVAVNAGCTLCDTFASAYQFVINAGGPVHFTHQGLRELHQIRKEIKRWGKQHLSNDEIPARLPELMARVKNILDTQLVRVRREDEGGDENDTSQNH